MRKLLQTDCVARLDNKHYIADLFYNAINKTYEVRLLGLSESDDDQIFLTSKLHNTVNFNVIEEYASIHFEPLFMGHIQFEQGHMIPLEYIDKRNTRTRLEISDHIDIV